MAAVVSTYSKGRLVSTMKPPLTPDGQYGPTGCRRASSDPRKSGTTKDECGVQEGLMRYG